jgi:hypothetical protein
MGVPMQMNKGNKGFINLKVIGVLLAILILFYFLNMVISSALRQGRSTLGQSSYVSQKSTSSIDLQQIWDNMIKNIKRKWNRFRYGY